jgi:hypothetical protein
VARDIARRSIVLVSDSNAIIDSLRSRHRPISLVIYGDENMPNAGAQLTAQLRAEGFPVNTFRLWPASGPESYDSAKAALRKNGVAMFAVSVKATANKGTVAMPEPLAKLIDQTAKKGRTVLASLGSPYLAQQTPHVGSYILAWNANSVTEWALAKAIAGSSDITGRLPITLTRSYPLGYGLQRRATRDTFGQAASGQP